jgi:hypothetical protein
MFLMNLEKRKIIKAQKHLVHTCAAHLFCKKLIIHEKSAAICPDEAHILQMEKIQDESRSRLSSLIKLVLYDDPTEIVLDYLGKTITSSIHNYNVWKDENMRIYQHTGEGQYDDLRDIITLSDANLYLDSILFYNCQVLHLRIIEDGNMRLWSDFFAQEMNYAGGNVTIRAFLKSLTELKDSAADIVDAWSNSSYLFFIWSGSSISSVRITEHGHIIVEVEAHGSY